MQIQDLSKELDAKALSAVHGGNNGNAATNAIGQEMKLVVPVAVGVGEPGQHQHRCHRHAGRPHRQLPVRRRLVPGAPAGGAGRAAEFTLNPTPRRTEMQIKDLTKDLDSKAMTAVHGGDNGNAGVNTVFQQLGMNVPIGIVTGPGAAVNNFIDVDGSQNASIDNQQDSGDKFLAFLSALKR